MPSGMYSTFPAFYVIDQDLAAIFCSAHALPAHKIAEYTLSVLYPLDLAYRYAFSLACSQTRRWIYQALKHS